MTLKWMAEQLAMDTWANVARRLYEAKPQKAWATRLWSGSWSYNVNYQSGAPDHATVTLDGSF